MLLNTLLKYNYILNNNTFSKLSYQRLATPQLIKKILSVPVPGMCRKAKFSLYQGKIHMTKTQTCFSQKKSNRKVSPNIFYKALHSSILGCRIKTHVSSTAYKTIKKYGGFDNYITCMDPKVMKSPYGQYLQTLMLRKIANPDMIVPYVLKSKQLKKIRQKYYTFRQKAKLIRPSIQDKFFNPKPFGIIENEMDDDQYAQYTQKIRIAKKNEDVDGTHPIIKQLRPKPQGERDEQMQALAEKARQDYFNIKSDKKLRKKAYYQSIKQIQQMLDKLRDDDVPLEAGQNDVNQQQQNQQFFDALDKFQKMKSDAIEANMKADKKMSSKSKRLQQQNQGQNDKDAKKSRKQKKQKKDKKQ